MCWETGQHWKAAMLSHTSRRFNGDSPGGGTEPWHLKAETGETGLSSPPLDSVQGSGEQHRKKAGGRSGGLCWGAQTPVR